MKEETPVAITWPFVTEGGKGPADPVRSWIPMTAFEHRYRVVDVTPLDYPNCHEFVVEHFRDGAWRIAIHQAMGICFADRMKADLVAGKLERGEDISGDMKRVPVRWWDRSNFDPSRSVVARRAAATGRNDEG